MFFTPETGMRALRNEIERRAATESRANSATRQDPCDKPQPPAALTRYQSLQPTSLLFSARVERGLLRVDESGVGKEMARHLNQAHKHYEVDSHGADDSQLLPHWNLSDVLVKGIDKGLCGLGAVEFFAGKLAPAVGRHLAKSSIRNLWTARRTHRAPPMTGLG